MGFVNRHMAAIEIDHATNESCLQSVEFVFEAFGQCMQELLCFAKLNVTPAAFGKEPIIPPKA